MAEEGSEILLVYQLKVACQLSVALEFGYRGKSVLEKARELARTAMGTSLYNVRRYGHRRSRKLVAKRRTFHSAHMCSDSMRINRNLLRRLPHPEFSEVSHAEFFITKAFCAAIVHSRLATRRRTEKSDNRVTGTGTGTVYG